MDPIPNEIRQFLAASIDSLEQLEALRFLSEAPLREWLAAELAGKVQATLESFLVHLTAMESRGLIRCERREGRIFCKLQPRSAELEAQLQKLLEFYSQRPVSMIRLVYERKDHALRAFSDAFKLRKEK